MREQPARDFPTTHWSLVRGAGHGDPGVRREALPTLLRQYLPPLRSHLVSRLRIDPHRADDLLQGFIADKVLGADLLRRADRARGKFRSFLLVTLDRFVLSQDRRERAFKRGGGGDPAGVEGLALTEPPGRGRVGRAPARPDGEYELAWARQVLALAIDQMEAQCRKRGREDLWGVFEARVLAPALDGAEPLPCEQLARRFGFASPAQASNAVATAKRMFERVLRSVVGQYADSEQAVEQELCDLKAILARGGGSDADA